MNRKFEPLPNLLEGSIGEFRPMAYHHVHLNWIFVETRDCSTTEVRVSNLASLLYENHRPWYKGWWRNYVGFHVWNPIRRDWPALQSFYKKIIPVHMILDRITAIAPHAFGEHRLLFYRLAQGLDVELRF